MKEVKKYVVTLIHFDKDGNYYVDNWVAENKKDARNIIEQTIKEIKEALKDYAESNGHIFTKVWGDTNNCNLYVGRYGKEDMDECMYEYKHKFHFTINEVE